MIPEYAQWIVRIDPPFHDYRCPLHNSPMLISFYWNRVACQDSTCSLYNGVSTDIFYEMLSRFDYPSEMLSEMLSLERLRA